MAFDGLIGIKMNEEEIFGRVTKIIQKNFGCYKDFVICLELGPADGDICFVKKVSFYNNDSAADTAAKRNYFDNRTHFAAHILTRFLDGFYFVSMWGHFLRKAADVYRYDIPRVHAERSSYDLATRKYIKLDHMEEAIEDIRLAVWNGLRQRR